MHDLPESTEIPRLEGRPLLVMEDKVLVGFKEAEWAAALEE